MFFLSTNSFFLRLPPSTGKIFSGHQPLQLGGVKKILPYRDSQERFRGFVGCIRNVVVDTKVELLWPILGLPLSTVNIWRDSSLCPFLGL